MSKKPTGNNELKNAFKSLQVSSPLRLSKSGPGMRPPSEAPLNEVVRAEAPRKEVSLFSPAENEVPQPGSETNSSVLLENGIQSRRQTPLESEVAQSGGARSELPQIEVPDNERPKNELAHSEQRRDEVAQAEATHREPPKQESPHNETPQNVAGRIARKEAPRFEGAELSQGEAPQYESTKAQTELVESSSNQGFFKLSHAVFSEPLLQELSGDCFRLFLWLSSRAWRFSKSNGEVRASVRFIEDQTGMSHATVSRALKTLKERNLVRLAETDFKRGNTWKVSSIAFGNRNPDDLPPQDERPQSKAPKKDSARPSNRGASHLNSSTKVPQNERNIRSIKNEKDITKDQIGTVISSFENKTEPDDQFREEAIERFESEMNDLEKNEIVRRFTEKAFPHGFLPPTKVVRSMAAIEWLINSGNALTSAAI
jgi:DNA-binding transcriptional ArsR family regulator